MIKNAARILITGGTGYLGARIGASLAARGHVVVLGSRKPFEKGEVKGCSQVQTNWDDPELSFCDGFDVIIHAAGMSATDCAAAPRLAEQFNGKITKHLAELASLYGCKKFFYLSTVHVYKNPLFGRFSEESRTLNQHPYATSHLSGEEALVNISGRSQMRASILRLSNCFGYPLTQDSTCWNLVLNQFIRDAFVAGKIQITGDHQEQRDFLSVKELCLIMMRLVELEEPIPRLMNISTGTSRTLLEAAENVAGIIFGNTGSEVSILRRSLSEGCNELLIENSLLKGLGISPDNSLDDEIKSMLHYLEQLSGEEVLSKN